MNVMDLAQRLVLTGSVFLVLAIMCWVAVSTISIVESKWTIPAGWVAVIVTLTSVAFFIAAIWA